MALNRNVGERSHPINYRDTCAYRIDVSSHDDKLELELCAVDVFVEGAEEDGWTNDCGNDLTLKQTHRLTHTHRYTHRNTHTQAILFFSSIKNSDVSKVVLNFYFVT